MLNEFSRTQLLYGKDAMAKLSQSRVAVFGRKCTEMRDIPGSTAFVPSVVGLIIAGEVINDLYKGYREIAENEYGIS